MGVAATAWARLAFAHALSRGVIEQLAMIITSVAIGSLFGCLLQDFLLPSLRQMRSVVLRARLGQSS
jgi:hypothetical protein